MPEERKLATMLFADIVGSSAIGEARDPEVVRAALGRTFDAISEVIGAHGGTVEKFIGDAVMAVFGVPTAHDDDAERAVRAAFAIRERTTEFEVRIGINSGEVVADTSREGQFLVTGGPVNAAARLQQAAAPGEIVVGALTRQLTVGGVRYGPARAVTAKGIGTLEVYPAEAMTSAVPEHHRGLPGLRAPLIGRDKELRLLRDAIARTAQDGAPYLLTVYGPPGAGKSRLVSELVAGTDVRVRIGRCLPYGEGITYYPIQLIVRADADIELTDTREAALAKLHATVLGAVGPEEADVIAARVAVLAGLADADALPDVGREELGDELRWGLRRYLERRAGSSPLLLVFEDIHWAEPKLLDLIEHLAESSRAPLCLVGLARPDFREARPNWGATALNGATITLAPLTGEDTRRLISALLAIDDLSEDVRTEVVARAEGNPLYVEEFLRMLMENGHIEQRDGRWIVAPGSGPINVPPTLTGLITARLDRVSGEVKQLLQRGSLAGRLFSTAALAVLGDGEPPHAELLRDAVRRDLLVEADERALGGGRVFRFKHALIREVAYASLPKSERSRLHDRYGRWLESSLAGRSGEIVDIVAHHAEQAYLLAHELGGSEVPALGPRALDLLLYARRAAYDRDDLPAGRTHADRAAAIADQIEVPPARRIEARAYAAQGRLDRDSTPESFAHAEAIAAEARGVTPSRAFATLLRQMAWYLALDAASDIARTTSIASEGLAVARAANEPETVASALIQVGVLAYWRGDLDASHRTLTEALAYMDESGEARGRPGALFWLSQVEVQRGAFAKASGYRSAGQSLLEARASKWTRNVIARERASLARRIGDYESALVDARSMYQGAIELALVEEIGGSAWWLGCTLLESGDPAQALRVLQESIEIFTRRHTAGFLGEVQALAARAAVLDGDVAAARAFADAALSVAIGWDWEGQCHARWAAAEACDAEGRTEDARRLFGEAIAVLPPAFGYEIAEVRAGFARFLIRHGQLAEARPILEAVRDFYHDPVAFRKRAAIEALLRQCDEVRA